MLLKSITLAVVTLLFTAIIFSEDLYAQKLSYIESIYYSEDNTKTKIVISSSQSVPYEYNTLIDKNDLERPYRLYIDFNPSKLSKDLSNIEIDNQIINRVRVGQFNESTSRVVIDLKKNVDFNISKSADSNSVVISLNNIGFGTNLKGSDSTINPDLPNVDAVAQEIKESNNSSYPDPLNSSNGNRPNGDPKSSEAFDPDAKPPLTIKVHDKLSFGGKVNFELEWRENNEDLDKDDQDTITTFESEWSIAGLYNPVPYIDIYAEGRLSDLQVLEDEPDEEEERTNVRLRRGYIFWRNFAINDFDIKAGRQRIKDDREWIYDENLDALRIYYDNKPFNLELSMSTLLFNGRRDRDKTINYIAYLEYEYAKKQKVALFNVIRQDRNASSEDRFFFGGSWRGRPFSRHNKVWLDSAASIQRDDSLQFVKGFGIDGGITKRFRVPWRPSFTVASAFGSNNFRQTGLEDNNARFNGKTKFRYYGELLDPELANLYIGTLGFGVIPRKQSRTSVDVVYHYYSQINKDDKLVSSDIDEDPRLDSKDIGHELDFIFGTNITKWVKFSLSSGVFFPGSAFRDDDLAYFSEIELQFSLR